MPTKREKEFQERKDHLGIPHILKSHGAQRNLWLAEAMPFWLHHITVSYLSMYLSVYLSQYNLYKILIYIIYIQTFSSSTDFFFLSKGCHKIQSWIKFYWIGDIKQ